MKHENNIDNGAASVINTNNETQVRNRNQAAGLRLKTRVKAGALSPNHNESQVRDTSFSVIFFRHFWHMQMSGRRALAIRKQRRTDMKTLRSQRLTNSIRGRLGRVLHTQLRATPGATKVDVMTMVGIFGLLAAAALPVSAAGLQAFVWNDIVIGSGVPNGYYQFNSTGAINSVTNLATGQYRVDLPGLGAPGGNVHVTAYGGNHYCKTQRWFPSGSTMQVFVNCFGPSGLPVNGRFTLLFNAQSGLQGTDGAYLWADNPTLGTSTPNLSYQWNSKGGTNTLTHSGKGSYQAILPGLTRGGVVRWQAGTRPARVWL